MNAFNIVPIGLLEKSVSSIFVCSIDTGPEGHGDRHRL
jgi:hypothetical protein